MAGVPGNQFTLYIGRQTAKGVAQTTPQYALRVTGGDISPEKNEIELQETDSTRQQGLTVGVSAMVKGAPSWYVRPDSFGLMMYGLLGANADSGTNPNYIHTATMVQTGALPYFTIYKKVGNSVLVDQYVDCVIAGGKIKGAAGQALTADWEIHGITPNLGATAPATVVLTQSPLVYPNVRAILGGSAPGTVESFEIDIMNNVDVVQGDNSIGPFDIVAGKLMVSGTYTMLFQNDQDYRNYFGAAVGATAMSLTVASQRLEFAILASANLGTGFVFNNVSLTAYPVNPDVSGKPVRVAVGWRATPDSTIANYVTATTRNGVATY